MIVADTSAIVALLNADDRHHEPVLELWASDPGAWVVPWAILPEVDYLARRYLGGEVARLFLADVTGGGFSVEHSQSSDLARALELDEQYRGLELGLVDGVVAAVAERLRARAIATLDLRNFAPLELAGAPELYPRDL